MSITLAAGPKMPSHQRRTSGRVGPTCPEKRSFGDQGESGKVGEDRTEKRGKGKGRGEEIGGR